MPGKLHPHHHPIPAVTEPNHECFRMSPTQMSSWARVDPSRAVWATQPLFPLKAARKVSLSKQGSKSPKQPLSTGQARTQASVFLGASFSVRSEILWPSMEN